MTGSLSSEVKLPLTHQFLSALVYWLGVSARASYVEAGVAVEKACERLGGFNELMLLVSTEVVAREDPGWTSRCDAALLEALEDQARIASLEAEVRWAVRQTQRYLADKG